MYEVKKKGGVGGGGDGGGGGGSEGGQQQQHEKFEDINRYSLQHFQYNMARNAVFKTQQYKSQSNAWLGQRGERRISDDNTLKTGKLVGQLIFKQQSKHITKLLKVCYFVSFGMFYRFIAHAGHFRKWSPSRSAESARKRGNMFAISG